MKETKHIILFVKGNQYKIAQYGIWNHPTTTHPIPPGIHILRFLKRYENSFYKLLTLLDGLIFAHDIYLNKNKNLPEYSLYTGANILDMIENNTTILKCDTYYLNLYTMYNYVYVVDFDKNRFEIYEGFNTKKLTPNERFYNLTKDGYSFQPPKKIKTFSLYNLPPEEYFNSIKKLND